MTNNEAIKKMKENMELRGLAPSTQQNYLITIKMFARNVTLPLKDLEPDHVQQFLYSYVKNNSSNSYIVGLYSSIKFLYHYVFKKENFMGNIPVSKRKVKLPMVLSIDEVKRIVKFSSNLKHKAMITLIYSSGLRINEAAKLKISDIDSKNMRVFIRQSKNNKDRYTILSRTALYILREYYKNYKPENWLFPGRNPLNPISVKSIQAAFKKALFQSKIKKLATVHTLRHSFSTHMIDKGVHLLALKELLGHSSLKTTSVYLHISTTRFAKITSPADTEGDFFNV